MIEGTPGKPYGGLLAHFNIVEANMRYRREEAQQLLGPDEVLMTITNFPRYVKLQYIQKTIVIFACPPSPIDTLSIRNGRRSLR